MKRSIEGLDRSQGTLFPRSRAKGNIRMAKMGAMPVVVFYLIGVTSATGTLSSNLARRPGPS